MLKSENTDDVIQKLFNLCQTGQDDAVFSALDDFLNHPDLSPSEKRKIFDLFHLPQWTSVDPKSFGLYEKLHSKLYRQFQPRPLRSNDKYQKYYLIRSFIKAAPDQVVLNAISQANEFDRQNLTDFCAASLAEGRIFLAQMFFDQIFSVFDRQQTIAHLCSCMLRSELHAQHTQNMVFLEKNLLEQPNRSTAFFDQLMCHLIQDPHAPNGRVDELATLFSKTFSFEQIHTWALKNQLLNPKNSFAAVLLAKASAHHLNNEILPSHLSSPKSKI